MYCKYSTQNTTGFSCVHSLFEINVLKIVFKKNLFINEPILIYFSSDTLEEEKALRLLLICLITFFSMYLNSFKNTCR